MRADSNCEGWDPVLMPQVFALGLEDCVFRELTFRKNLGSILFGALFDAMKLIQRSSDLLCMTLKSTGKVGCCLEQL